LKTQTLDRAVVVRLAGGFQLRHSGVESRHVRRMVLVVVESQRFFVVKRFEGVVVVRKWGKAVFAVLVGPLKRAMHDGCR
jgi:hypothetical protein